MLIDTHSHLNFIDYDKDREEVIKRSLGIGVFMLNVGTNYESSRQAVKIAEKYEQGVFAAIGLHPININQKSKIKNQNENAKCKKKNLKLKKNEDALEENFEVEKYKDLARSKKVVAIGEIGLDYWDLPKSKTKAEEYKDKQKEVLFQQLGLAKELNLPAIFHCRKAHQDLSEVLKSQIPNPKSQINSKFKIQNSKLHGVVHCFTGDWTQAQKYLAAGLYLGFNGIIYKLDLTEVIKKCPLDRMLIETDCPFLTPPEAGVKRNEPEFVRYIMETIAELRGDDFGKIAEATTKNAVSLFSF